MKMKREHYQYIKDQLATFTAGYIEGYRDAIVKEGKSKDIDMRVRWDLIYQKKLSRWMSDNLYPYLNDDHIDTALRQIMQEIKV